MFSSFCSATSVLLRRLLFGRSVCSRPQSASPLVNDCACACDGAGPSEDRGGRLSVAGGVLDERWRWRVLSAKALPHFSGPAALMAPPQATQLQVLEESIRHSDIYSVD